MILNKKNLLFLIHKHYEINRKQGFYIEKEINKIYDSNDENLFEMKGIIDPNAFLFEIKNGKIEYYEIQKGIQQEVFYLYPPQSEHLFTIGNDIEIFKRNHYGDDYKTKLTELSTFQNSNNEIIEENKYFLRLRIQVIQMEDENDDIVLKLPQDDFMKEFK